MSFTFFWAVYLQEMSQNSSESSWLNRVLVDLLIFLLATIGSNINVDVSFHLNNLSVFLKH